MRAAPLLLLLPWSAFAADLIDDEIAAFRACEAADEAALRALGAQPRAKACRGDYAGLGVIGPWGFIGPLEGDLARPTEAETRPAAEWWPGLRHPVARQTRGWDGGVVTAPPTARDGVQLWSARFHTHEAGPHALRFAVAGDWVLFVDGLRLGWGSAHGIDFDAELALVDLAAGPHRVSLRTRSAAGLILRVTPVSGAAPDALAQARATKDPRLFELALHHRRGALAREAFEGIAEPTVAQRLGLAALPGPLAARWALLEGLDPKALEVRQARAALDLARGLPRSITTPAWQPWAQVAPEVPLFESAKEAIAGACGQPRGCGALSLAIGALRAAVLRSPEWAEAHALLGDALHRVGHEAAAVESWARALDLDPLESAARKGLGAPLPRDDLRDARAAAREARPREDVPAWYLFDRVLYEAGWAEHVRVRQWALRVETRVPRLSLPVEGTVLRAEVIDAEGIARPLTPQGRTVAADVLPGDTLHVLTTWTRKGPFGGVELAGGAWPKAEWSLQVRWREGPPVWQRSWGVGPADSGRQAQWRHLSWRAVEVAAAPKEPGAPASGRAVAFSALPDAAALGVYIRELVRARAAPHAVEGDPVVAAQALRVVGALDLSRAPTLPSAVWASSEADPLSRAVALLAALRARGEQAELVFSRSAGRLEDAPPSPWLFDAVGVYRPASGALFGLVGPGRGLYVGLEGQARFAPLPAPSARSRAYELEAGAGTVIHRSEGPAPTLRPLRQLDADTWHLVGPPRAPDPLCDPTQAHRSGGLVLQPGLVRSVLQVRASGRPVLGEAVESLFGRYSRRVRKAPEGWTVLRELELEAARVEPAQLPAWRRFCERIAALEAAPLASP